MLRLLLDVSPENKSVNTIMQNRIKLVPLMKVAASFFAAGSIIQSVHKMIHEKLIAFLIYQLLI